MYHGLSSTLWRGVPIFASPAQHLWLIDASMAEAKNGDRLVGIYWRAS